jgi:DeoR/GlpR family transcriptional regulator of sugar metabolism
MQITMKPKERQNKILEILRAMQKEIRVEELADMLDVSHLTVRRDLDILAKDRTIIRTHGGCLAVGRAALETEYHKKVAKNFELKRAIARRAVEDIAEHEVILMNDGSTTFHLAAQLGLRQNLTVYTNSLAMISEFSRYQNINLYLLGGEYNDEHYSMRGSLTEQMLDQLQFSRVYLGADAVDRSGRCMVSTPDEARLTQVMLERSEQKILLADHTKVGASGFNAYTNLSDFDIWITTEGMDETVLRDFREMTEIICVSAVDDEPADE